MTSKRCSKCGVVKPLDEFARDRTKRDGRRSRCRVCTNEELRLRRSGNGGLRGRPVGRQLPSDPVVCVHDPTGTYAGLFDRMSFAGTLFDGYWPERAEFELSASYGGTPSRWVVRGQALHEVDGARVLVAVGHADRPVLREVE